MPTSAVDPVRDRNPEELTLIKKSRWWWISALLTVFTLILGVRLTLITRFGTNLPIADEWHYLGFLEEWQQGAHHWSGLFDRNGQHLILGTRLMQLVSLWLNGLWEPKFQSIIHATIYALYAVVAAATLTNVVAREFRLKMLLAVIFLFAVPFSGYRAIWSFLDQFTYVMLCAVLVPVLLCFRPWRFGISEFLAAIMMTFAALSLGSGCLVAVAAGVFLVTDGILCRRISPSALALILYAIVLFVFATYGMPKSATGDGPRLPQIVKTLFSSLAWPSVFFAPAGLFSFLPAAILSVLFLRGHYKSDPKVKCLVMLVCIVTMQCVAIGIFRSDGSNFGMPSGRYNDILILAPLVNLGALFVLLQQFPASVMLRWLNRGWLFLTIAGCAMHILWRTWPFLARENGEWYEAAKQESARHFVETGDAKFVPDLNVAAWSEEMNISDRPDEIRSLLRNGTSSGILTIGAMVGVNIEQASTDPTGFAEGAYPKPYYAHPAFRYWGSYTDSREAQRGEFISQPFRVNTDYLVFDLIVEKKARFSRYRLDGLGLYLVDLESGATTSLLPQLASSFPWVFRDRETIYIKVSRGKQYVLKATDQTESNWFAFSQPWEAGRMTPITETLLASGKLTIFGGLLLLFLTMQLRVQWNCENRGR